MEKVENMQSKNKDFNKENAILNGSHFERENPHDSLQARAQGWDISILDRNFAVKMDTETGLPNLRHLFHYPKMGDLPVTDTSLVDSEEDCVYLVGNSLGLQPIAVREKLDRELKKWSKIGAHGHLLGDMPWAYCDECVDENMAKLVGALRSEVTVMNGLTVNLHLQLIPFYRPTPQRYKILIEDHSFPSDHYAVESEIRLKGYDPKDSMICLKPRKGEHTLREKDILKVIEEEGKSIAVILLSGVHYYTGQYFDIPTITKAGQEKGCYVGWDLAHAAGNVDLYLHDWGVDFACWCTYKYINTGAGGIAGFFIHEKHFEEFKSQPRLVGWWSHKMDTRFQMSNELDLEEGARGFRISNPPPLLCAPLEASLEVFGQTNMKDLRSKSVLLTGYLELLLKHFYAKYSTDTTGRAPGVEVITPSEPERRGAQLSLKFTVPINAVFKELEKRGVACDKREPDVLRVAPVPLYNTFLDVYRFVKLLSEAIHSAAEATQEKMMQ